jgi:hypothetical protein
MSHDDSPSTPRAVRRGFAPHIKQLAIFAFEQRLTPCSHTIAALDAVDAAFPNLSFRDFAAALRVLAAYERETGGHA